MPESPPSTAAGPEASSMPESPRPAAAESEARVPPRESSPDPRRASWIGRRLAIIGGMRPDLVDEFPAERRDFAQMALILFVTAMEALISGAFAIGMAFSRPDQAAVESAVDAHAAGDTARATRTVLTTVLHTPDTWILLTCGLVWAIIIFNIDRYMVLGMEGLHRFAVLVPALIRGVLAVLIGFVMSTPLVLQIFDQEIRQSMVSINFEESEKLSRNIKVMQEQVAAAEAKVATKKRELDSAKSGTNLQENDTYTSAETAYTQALAKCNAAQNKATLELRGELPIADGGSGKPGDSDVYRSFQRQADDLCALAGEKKKYLDTVSKSAVLTPEEVQAQVDASQAAYDGAVADASDARGRLQQQQGNVESVSGGTWGLLTRLKGLHEITSSGGTALWTHIALLALLASIELLPVLFKTFKQWGAIPTPYECRWRDIDNGVIERSRVADENFLAAMRISSYQPVANAVEMRRQQDGINQHITGEIMGVQLRVMQQALRDWAKDHNVDYQPTAYEPPREGARGAAYHSSRPAATPASGNGSGSPTWFDLAEPETTTIDGTDPETTLAAGVDDHEPDSSPPPAGHTAWDNS